MVERLERGVVANQVGDVGRSGRDLHDVLARRRRHGDAAGALAVLDQFLDLLVGHQGNGNGQDIAADRGDVLDQLGEVRRHPGDHQLHAHGAVRQDLHQLRHIAAELRVDRPIELVEDDQHASAGQLAAQVAELTGQQRPGRQQAGHRVAALGLRRGRTVVAVEQQRNVLGDGAEGLVEVGGRAAGQVDDDVAGGARGRGQHVQQGRLADAPLAVDHQMQALVLDGADGRFQHAQAAGEHPGVEHRLRRGVGRPQLHPHGREAIVAPIGLVRGIGAEAWQFPGRRGRRGLLEQAGHARRRLAGRLIGLRAFALVPPAKQFWQCHCHLHTGPRPGYIPAIQPEKAYRFMLSAAYAVYRDRALLAARR